MTSPLPLDLVVRGPARLSSAVREALKVELLELGPTMMRSRFHLAEDGAPAELVRTLDAIARRGSAGVLLNAPDDPAVADAINRLDDHGIPVVTLGTDSPLSRRTGHIGFDDRAAGATAAYLVSRTVDDVSASVLMISSSSRRDVGERRSGFYSTMRTLAPDRAIRELSGVDGPDVAGLNAVARVLDDDPALCAVYSTGSGSTAIVEAFRRAGRVLAPFIAHDLDGENAALLRQGRITAVLHHDLRADVRQAYQLILQAQQAPLGQRRSILSQVKVITPFNYPTSY